MFTCAWPNSSQRKTVKVDFYYFWVLYTEYIQLRWCGNVCQLFNGRLIKYLYIRICNLWWLRKTKGQKRDNWNLILVLYVVYPWNTFIIHCKEKLKKCAKYVYLKTALYHWEEVADQTFDDCMVYYHKKFIMRVWHLPIYHT